MFLVILIILGIIVFFKYIRYLENRRKEISNMLDETKNSTLKLIQEEEEEDEDEDDFLIEQYYVKEEEEANLKVNSMILNREDSWKSKDLRFLN